VYTKRVKVLHVTDSDAVVPVITYYFVLNLLPASQILINDDLFMQQQAVRTIVAAAVSAHCAATA
jgi:hypothetical protein